MIKRSIIGILMILIISHIARASAHIIPFRLVNNLIVFQAMVEGQFGNFILDTGISDMVLNQAFFEGNAHLIGGGQFQSIHGESPSNREDHVQLLLHGLSLRSYAVVIDLSPLEKTKRLNILGLVGIRTFQKYEMVIDFFSQNLFLYELDKKGDRLLQDALPAPKETLTFRYKEHIPYISAWIGHTELKLGLDTGVGTNVFSPRVLEGLKNEIGALHIEMVIGVDGQMSYAPSGQIENLRTANLELPAMETLFISTASFNELSGPALDGLLGQELLKHFRTAINFKKKEIYLWDASTIQEGSLVSGKN